MNNTAEMTFCSVKIYNHNFFRSKIKFNYLSTYLSNNNVFLRNALSDMFTIKL